MKFSPEKKETIKAYILEKIAQKQNGVAKYVSKELGISLNTIYSYLGEMQNDKILLKKGRNDYEILARQYKYVFKRSEGELEHDTYAYEQYLYPLIKKFSTNVENIWAYAMSEMVNNVIDHSEAEELCVFIEQSFLTTSVMLIDNGIGIFKKIKDHFALPGLDEAVCELFKGKLTTDAENHSGEGIFFTSRMMDTFVIVSDKKIFATTKYESDRVFELAEEIGGTAVFMELSNTTQKTPAEIFDAYSDVEGGFSKTKIPLKNIFDKAPISRSQAKRICHRLEQFQEIVIDFEGIEWMGQGFAHQLFVLYAKAHPDVKIVPENMKSEVKKMYLHVIGTDAF